MSSRSVAIEMRDVRPAVVDLVRDNSVPIGVEVRRYPDQLSLAVLLWIDAIRRLFPRYSKSSRRVS